MNLDEACAFLSDISSIPASLIRTDKDLNAFCDRYFFDAAAVTNIFTEPGFLKFTSPLAETVAV